MEINTTTQTTSTYTTTKQKDSSSSDGSFEEALATQSQKDSKITTSSKKDYIETSDTTTQTQTVTYTQDVAKVQDDSYDPDKKFLNFLDEKLPDYFEKNGISKEDEEVIRGVLSDNEVSDHESRQLNFEQAQILHKIEFNRFEYGPEDSNNMMVLPVENEKVQHILGITTFTKNDTFNEAIFKTFVENLTLEADEMMKVREELAYTLRQAYNGMDLGFNINQAPTPPMGASNQFNNEKFDYDNYLTKLLSHLDMLLNKPNDPDVRKQYELLNENFSKILENYQEIKK